MTGESQHDDNDDFLDDDFVIEDIAPKNEDLDRLFEAPPGGVLPAAVDPAAPDAEDVLFTEPEVGYEPSTTFQGREQFAESSAAPWEGAALDLDAEAAPGVPEPVEAIAAAEESFTKELDSLLQGDEDFALDSERELEVIGDGGAAPADGISEFEQSGPFVLDDGEGLWQDEQEQAAAAAAGAEVEEFGVPLHAGVGDDEGEAHEPGWEPLPSTNVDGLAEVDEVARAEEAEADPVYGEDFAKDEAVVPALALVGAAAEADAEDHDELYVQDGDGNEVVGARERGGRGFRVLLSLAAMLTVLSGAAVVVLRPEWVGLRLQPDRVQQAEMTRPTIAVDVSEPNLTSGKATEPTSPRVAVEPPAPVEPPKVAVEPPPEPKAPEVAVEPPAPVEPPKVAVEPPPEPKPPEVVVAEPEPVVPSTQVAVEPQPEPPTPVAVEPGEVAELQAPLAVVTAPTPELPGWPTAQAVPDAPRPGDGQLRQPSRLVRVSEELMIGEPDDSGNRPRGAGGLIPGSRAFAQLQNGNYFIGNVKAVDSQRITLRVENNGEVTIPVAAIARLTELGSADYEDLQKVTSGFVRLTNNNRLVGGILSGIADDHIVLEFRKNRVMLPKSLIGEIVQGEDDAGIRLDTTREEDDWLRHLVERQLGTGVGAQPPTPPQGSQSPR